jgi:hypothetical protein
MRASAENVNRTEVKQLYYKIIKTSLRRKEGPEKLKPPMNFRIFCELAATAGTTSHGASEMFHSPHLQ